MTESSSDTLIQALIKNHAIAKKSLLNGSIPPAGEVELLKPYPTGEYDSPYTIDAKYLWALSERLKAEGLTEFEYINHGQHAIILKARNSRYEEKNGNAHHTRRAKCPYLRIHFGPPHSRQPLDAFSSLTTTTIENKITCEEVEYFNVPGPNNIDPKITLGLGISCLVNGDLFNDPHGGNVAMRLGDTRVGVLEPQAIEKIGAEDFHRGLSQFFEYIGEMRHHRDGLRKLNRFINDYSQGDVIETLSNTVVILNGDFYKSMYAGKPKQHPCLEERKQLVKDILAKENIDYKEFMGEFIVIPQPNPYPPNQEKLRQSMKLAVKLRSALDAHEQARLESISQGAVSNGEEDNYLKRILGRDAAAPYAIGQSAVK